MYALLIRNNNDLCAQLQSINSMVIYSNILLLSNRIGIVP